MSGSREFHQWTGVVLFILIAVVFVAIAALVMGVTGPMGIEERFTSAVGLHQEQGASPEGTGSAFSLEGHPLLYALFLAMLLIAGFLLYRKYNL